MDTLDDTSVLIPDVFEVHARIHPHKEAVVCGPVRRSWGDFAANINRVANALNARGIGPGHQVAVLMGNSVEILEIMFGVVRAGACVVPLSGLLTGEQLATLVDDSDAVAMFATADFIDRLGEHRDRCTKVRADALVSVFCDSPGWQGYEAFLQGAAATPPAASCHAALPFNIIYSSGTTGLPKGIVQTHRTRTHWAMFNAIGMMARYHRRDEQTAALIWRDTRGRSWIRSGDVGKLDDQGYITLVDRKKDMIISGGFNVFPTDIEAVVGGHPDVLDVTVIGIPHDKWGETVLALVIPQAGATPDAAAIVVWANERLARHQRLAAVEFRDEFPRNALGKVLKRILREPYWAGTGRQI